MQQRCWIQVAEVLIEAATSNGSYCAYAPQVTLMVSTVQPGFAELISQEEGMHQEKVALYSSAHFDRMRAIWLSFVVVTLTVCAVLPANAAAGQFIAHNTPRYVATAKNLGTEDPSKTIEVSIWLNPHNRGEMDALARQLYDRTSANYRHFLTRSQIASRFAPTAEEAKTVQQFFEAHNLKVVTVGPDNFFVRAQGTVGDVETAFRVQLNNYQVRDEVIRANASDPYVEGDAASLVRAVSGLDTGGYEHPFIGLPTLPGTAPAAPVTPSSFFNANCFNGVVTQKFSTDNNGTLPIGTYTGNHLNLESLTSAGCAYTPPSIQTAYNLTGLYGEGYSGQGQTIAIIDVCGSSTIHSDANAFSAKFGLPLLNSSNFGIIYTPTPSLCIAPGGSGPDQIEISIDVEWAHAIAPLANIDLVIAPSFAFQDVDQALFYAVNYALGNVTSGSYGFVESFTSGTELDSVNLISEIGAISGISTNFASGDDGDFTAFGIPATVLTPADSPWATAVGGVSLALNPSDDSIAWQAGWGNNEVLLTETGSIADPPENFGFYAGAGGGPSGFFSKPSFQSSLPGTFRQLPDVSWLADPFTGVAILISIPSQVPEQVWQVYGGTSVATPMFSGLWAIANQEAGVPLGQAAQYMYSLPTGAVTDIVPVGSTTNVKASIKESSTVTNTYDPSEVLGGATPGKFISAIWDYPSLEDTTLVISFGTDCSTETLFPDGNTCNSSSSLHTKVGWDNVTGVGVPNGKAFADSFK